MFIYKKFQSHKLLNTQKLLQWDALRPARDQRFIHLRLLRSARHPVHVPSPVRQEGGQAQPECIQKQIPGIQPGVRHAGASKLFRSLIQKLL